MTPAEEILDTALADPRATIEAGEKYLGGLPPDSHSERAITLRAMSLGARYTNRVEASIDFARRAADEAAQAGREDLRLLGLLTMTGSMGIAGRYEEALNIVHSTIDATPETEFSAKFRFQEGGILSMMGKAAEAVEVLELVLPMFRQLGDKASVEITHGQLGLNLTQLGRLAEAEMHLAESLRLASELGETAAIQSTEHNLGLLAAYRGDIPTALEWLQKSDEHLMTMSGSTAPQHVARCEVLISAGLYAEAQKVATWIAHENRQKGDVEHAVNALIVAAEAALLRGDIEQAAELAGETVELTSKETDSVRHARARRIDGEARFILGGPSRELLEDINGIASDLTVSGQLVSAGQAHLLAGRVALALDERDLARQSFDRVASVGTGPIETRLQAHLARGLVRLDAGDTRGATAAVRSGLGLLDKYQAALGASDLRSGIERQGVELATIGLGLALDSRRPRRILEWLDRTRARSLRYQSVLPARDDEVARSLGELRRVEAELRRPEHHNDTELSRRRRRLQEEIAGTDRVRRETKASIERFSVNDLIDSLGTRTLFEIGVHEGSLHAVLVRRGRARLIELGDADQVLSELSQVRFGMRRAARVGRAIDAEAAGRLDEMLLGDFALDTDELVLVPPPSLMAVPWAALPRLWDRIVTVSPSAEMWWRAYQRKTSGNEIVVAGGPDLDVAEGEVAAVASLYPDATSLPPGATVEEVRTHLGGAALAHIASHASFQVENPMFSSLRLGDGDLNVYDIERLEAPPSTVVLSACDSGYTETRSGDELAGLTSALLSMGTRSIVASVGLVPDSEATSALMVRFHRSLLDGLEPAAALAAARAGSSDEPADFIAAASFVCVGG